MTVAEATGPIVMEGPQGTPEWNEMRRGVLTASSFSSIVTTKGAKSTQSIGVLHRLVGEWLSGEVEDFYTSAAMSRGFMMQPEAIEWYEMQRDCDVHEVAHVYMDDRYLIGASPDGLVHGDPDGEGGLEIKSPLLKEAIATLLGDKLPTSHVQQVQGSMMVTGAAWWDFLSYHPKLPKYLVRVYRDEDYIKILRERCEEFVDAMLRVLDQYSDHIVPRRTK